MTIDYLPVTWNDYHNLAATLADRILTDKLKIDEIVAISRGGLTLGHILTDLLAITISTFTIQSYTDIQTQGEVKITKPLTTPIDGKHVLLVDDVSDTGKTLVRAIDYLKTFQPKAVTTLTLYYKPHAVYKPDYFAETTSAWILFPYEPIEMIKNIMQSMKKEQKSDANIQQFLQSLHYTTEQINFAKKWYTS
ncbi:phosphoribosyltransferase [Candidatus Gottesmanbacteria bacterium]|nr:phosphoribosyltransferase [Candidatus Gottesmanbacteria bacterium]